MFTLFVLNACVLDDRIDTVMSTVSGIAAEAEAGTGAEAAAIQGEVVVSFDFERQSGSASNQHAVWIEDMDGNLVKTLYASNWTASGGYKSRPDSIALWVEKSNLASLSKQEVDAVSGATPRTGALSYSWDLTGADGAGVPGGEYKVLVEGTLRWKNYVVYTGVINIGDKPETVQAVAEYNYEGIDRYAALTDSATENKMIGPVTVVYTPSP